MKERALTDLANESFRDLNTVTSSGCNACVVCGGKDIIFTAKIYDIYVYMSFVTISKKDYRAHWNNKFQFFIHIKNNSVSIQPDSLRAYKASSGPSKRYCPPGKDLE